MPKGQEEAGLVLGMTKSQIFFKIKLLQMIKRIVPPMSNEIITLVKGYLPFPHHRAPGDHLGGPVFHERQHGDRRRDLAAVLYGGILSDL